MRMGGGRVCASLNKKKYVAPLEITSKRKKNISPKSLRTLIYMECTSLMGMPCDQ